ncbi:MAG: hypothetical protein ABI591_00580 [Kofleriaceae bacterium]
MKALACLLLASCATAPRPFPFREPFVTDTDLKDVSVDCRPDPTKNDVDHKTCAPREYVSPFIWDQLDNVLFARISRGLAIHTSGESANVNSLDEVPDSSWFTNKPRGAASHDDAPGACKPEDMLGEVADVKPGEWVIDHGKDNGSTLGFRVNIPGKGKYMFKADDEGLPERASAASVIGAAIYDEVGFNTSCEQVVVFKKEQLALTPGLKVVDNEGISHPFDEAALDKTLDSTTHLPGREIRMQASKWLPGQTLGPFRYIGTRADDPNDVIGHEHRRELRGSRILAAWIGHWDAREQNSMDVWFAADSKNKSASPGHVMHYILDTSDTMGGAVGVDDMSRRLGHSYNFDFGDVTRSIFTFGIMEFPWDRATELPGKEKFSYFSTRDFHPGDWKPLYPNPAFLEMTEHDAAWMARKLARFSHDDILRLVELGRWQSPGDVAFLTNTLEVRLQRILTRYFSKLSPLGEVRQDGGKICATDFARLRGIGPASASHYAIVERHGGRAVALAATTGEDGAVCFAPQPMVTGSFADGDPHRRVVFDVRNGTRAGPLRIHVYDLGAKGMKIVGLERFED